MPMVLFSALFFLYGLVLIIHDLFVRYKARKWWKEHRKGYQE